MLESEYLVLSGDLFSFAVWGRGQGWTFMRQEEMTPVIQGAPNLPWTHLACWVLGALPAGLLPPQQPAGR